MVVDRWLDNFSNGMRWWWGGLLGCVPTQVVRYFKKEEETLWLRFSNNDSSIFYRFRSLDGRVDDLKKLQDILGWEANTAVGYGLLVEVDREDVFRRMLEVPAAEANQLDNYINRHFSEICPYEPSTVMFRCAIRSANIEAGTVQVDVTFFFKSFVRRCKDLQLAGVPPQKGAIYTESDDKRVWLYRWEDKLNASLFRKAIIVFSLFLAVFLPAAAIHYVQSQLNSQYVVLVSEQKRIKREVSEYLVLIDRAEKLKAEERDLLQARYRSQAVLALLDDVAETLPNSSWLQKLELKGDDLQISGYGASTAKLPQLLEQSKFFHSVQLSAPIVPDPITGKERFSIQMKVNFDLVAVSPTMEKQF